MAAEMPSDPTNPKMLMMCAPALAWRLMDDER